MYEPCEQLPPYKDWRSVAQAIKSASTHTARPGEAGSVASQILQAHFDRLLSRVFFEGDDSQWLLKGGTAMLARVPLTRATKDIDLAYPVNDLASALPALEASASRDLGDHLAFSLTATRQTGLGDNQPGVQTAHVTFTAADAESGRRVGDLQIDVVVGPPPVGHVETVVPANRLPLPRLISRPYRLFPIADQIAEKVCATMYRNYGGSGRSSSRVKDLVDLVVILKTQRVELLQLQRALTAKRLASQMDDFDEFRIPANWAETYRRLANATPAVGGVIDAAVAENLVAGFVQPALAGRPIRHPIGWTPGRGWTSRAIPFGQRTAALTTAIDDTRARAGRRRPGSDQAPIIDSGRDR